jgi:RNA polymerase sigma-70 factor (ECF subfamily)
MVRASRVLVLRPSSGLCMKSITRLPEVDRPWAVFQYRQVDVPVVLCRRVADQVASCPLLLLKDSMALANEEPPGASGDWFTTTHWSMVRAAGTEAVPLARAALEKLCAAYWPPLYAYVRRRGNDPYEAQDLTQEFFARLLARNDFAGLHPEAGRFRAFLLASMNHFLASEWRKAGTQKRGARQIPLSIDNTAEEQMLAGQAATGPAPERLFDRRWAETVMERAGQQLRDEFTDGGRAPVFRELNVYLSTPAAPGDYAVIAERLQMTEAAVAKAVERLRRRFRDLVRREVSQTVTSPDGLEEEMRYLIDVLSGSAAE